MTPRQRLTCALICTALVVFNGIRLVAGTTTVASTVLTVISVLAGVVGLTACAIGYLESQR